MNALSQTVSATLTFDAAGIPTGVTAGQKETLVAGTIKAITSKLSGDQVVKGIGATVADALVVYGTSQATRKVLVGNFAFNPLKRDA